jgi:hypothetical protein
MSRLGASGVIIARKAIVGSADFNAAVVRPSLCHLVCADMYRSSDRTCIPTYVDYNSRAKD